MKKISLLALPAVLLCACQQQQAPRNTIRLDVPIYTVVKKAPTKYKSKRKRQAGETVEVTMVSLTGPEAKGWEMFDRADAIMKYNEMSLQDKTVLFETVARVYRHLPKNNTLSSQAINAGIWKEVTDKGVNLSFGDDPADWHPYLMYIHPIVISEMADFFLNAKEESITNAELNDWQIAGCNVINARPDKLSMAALLHRKDELAQAGIIITEVDKTYRAHTKKVDWDKYRAARSAP